MSTLLRPIGISAALGSTSLLLGWLGVALLALNNPWLELVALAAELPFWLFSLLPNLLVQGFECLAGIEPSSVAEMPSLVLTIGSGGSVIECIRGQLVLLGVGVLLYALAYSAVKKIFPQGSSLRRRLPWYVLTGICVTYLYWVDILCVFYALPGSSDTNLGTVVRVMTFIQGVLLESAGSGLPKGVLSSHESWPIFVFRSSLLALVTAGLAAMLWETSRLAYRHVASYRRTSSTSDTKGLE